MNARQRERADEMERTRCRLWAELEEVFCHRYDNLAEARRFQSKLRYYVAFVSDGTVATSRTAVLHQLIVADRKLAAERARMAHR